MKKIVLAKGGLFHLSDEAQEWLWERGFGIEFREKMERDLVKGNLPTSEWKRYISTHLFYKVDIGQWRSDPLLIECIKIFGERASESKCVQFIIKEYDDETYIAHIREKFSGEEYLFLEEKIIKFRKKEENNMKCPKCGKELDLEDYETYYDEESEDTSYYVICSKCGYTPEEDI